MNRLKFFPYFMPIINLSVGILSLSALPYNDFSYSRIILISLSGIFVLILNLYYNRYVLLNLNNKALKLFSSISIFIVFSIIPSILFYTKFNFISFKFLNYFLLLLYPVCSSFAIVNDYINNKNIVFNNLLVILLYIYALITANKNVTNFLPILLIIFVSLVLVWENFSRNFLDFFK